jgi:acyl-CoA synthetase (AMP-forming)/AMP-acid ligase II
MGGIQLTGDVTFHRALAQVVEAYPDREALIVDPERVRYRELGQRVNALAAGLYGLGLKKGEKVAAILPNCPAMVYAFIAVGQTGGVLVPVNPLYRRREIQHILSDAEASAVIFARRVRGNDLLGMLQDMREELPHLRHLILDEEPAPESVMSLKQLMRPGQPEPPADLVGPDDLFGLLYTSGTTGSSKAVMHTHRTMLTPVIAALEETEAVLQRGLLANLVSMAKITARYGPRFLRWGRKQRTNLVTSPLHVMAGYSATLPSLLLGTRVVVMERFHPAQALSLIQREQVNILVGTPSMYSTMLKVGNFDEYDKSSLLFCVIGTAPCPPELARQVRRRFNCPVMIPFGATETGALTMTGLEDSDDVRAETVGRPFRGARIKIVDDQRREVPAGEVGELACHLQGIMLGYYKAPEATAQSLDDEGWYYTGDLAVRDAEGYVRIVGRKKDMIIRGGQNIYPQEIENYLLSHPDIQEAAVVGVPSEREGETVWAYVVPRDGSSLTPEDVLNYCRGEISAFKVPGVVRLVDELPRTATQKVQKFLLRDQAASELQRPAEAT